MTTVRIFCREFLHFAGFTEDRNGTPEFTEWAGEGHFFSAVFVTDVTVDPPASSFFFDPDNIVIDGDRSPSSSEVGSPLHEYQKGVGIVINPKNGFLFKNWGGGAMELFRNAQINGQNRPGHPVGLAYFEAGEDYQIVFHPDNSPIRVENLVEPSDLGS